MIEQLNQQQQQQPQQIAMTVLLHYGVYAPCIGMVDTLFRIKYVQVMN